MAISKIKDSNGNIHELSVDWSNVTNPPATVGYGTCSTLGNVAEKVVTISDTSWVLKVGSIIGVKYSYTNLKPKVKLNVNGTGAKSIYYNKSEYLLGMGYICGDKDRVIYYMYDGTYWVWISAGYLESDTDKKTSSTKKDSTKLYLVGAKSQSSSGQTTYSNSKCYVGEDNCLYSNDTKVSVDGHTHYLSVTYSELLNLRNDDGLIPGQQYRITDYVTTTAQENTKSAGHPFDIIVTALDEGTLCEEAKAVQSYTDGYFDSCNLSAWKIWYSLDNDFNRFKWANGYNYDSDNGLYEFNNWVTAVAKVCDDQIDTFYEVDINEKFSHFGYTEDKDGITRLTLYGRDLDGDTDKGLNTCTLYHYKGVYNVDGVDYDGWAQFIDDIYAADANGNPVYVLTERIVYNGEIIRGKGVIYRMIDEWGNDCPYDFKNIMFKREIYAEGGGVTTIEGDGDFVTYCYTFSWEDAQNEIIDASIAGNNGYLLNDEDQISGVYGNVIGVHYNYEYEQNYITQQYLNDIVFFSTFGYDGGYYYGCYNNTFGNDCRNNTFGSDCFTNTFGNNCYRNTFDYACYNNTFGNNCYNNTFDNSCNGNTFGNRCYNNTFGNSCNGNTFGNGCYNNTFDNRCYYNTFGNGCGNNTFGNDCFTNTFGEYCNTNTFHQTCSENTFGNECNHNTFRNGCGNNTFGDSCEYNTFGDECSNNSFDNLCSRNTFGNYCDYNTFGNNCNGNTFGDRCEYNTFGNGCTNNTFVTDCYSNTFGDYCYQTTFGDRCEYNTFGNDCDANTFGIECSNNTFGNSCHENEFGDGFSENTFGNECYENTFGDSCSKNTFGDECSNNAFEYKCSSNTFGNRCSINTFGNECSDNAFDNNCSRNTFGDLCENNTFGNRCSINTFGNECYRNTFGNDCYGNTFYDGCCINTFGNDCYSNEFGNGCSINTFGNECYENTFETDCYYNTFDNNCYSNTFGNDCSINTFGNYCISNTFGNNCYYNTFGNDCNANTFGSDCHDNTFGNECIGNEFGTYCVSNTFGNGCTSNTFGKLSSSGEKVTKSYYENIIFDNNNKNIYLNCTQTTSSSYIYKNVRIGLGVNNSSTTKTIDDSNINQNYETLYVSKDNKTITI